MRCLRVGVGLLVLGLAVSAGAEEKKKESKGGDEAGKLEIEVKFAKALESRQPVDPSNSVDAGKLYCWNLVKGGEGDFKLYHVWYREGKKVHRQGLQVKGKKWITWSFHNVTPGGWKVEITDASGTVLQTGELTVK